MIENSNNLSSPPPEPELPSAQPAKKDLLSPKIILLLILIIILSVTTFGLWLYKEKTTNNAVIISSSSVTPLPTPSYAKLAKTIPANWKIYRNEEFGLELEYPPDLVVKDWAFTNALPDYDLYLSIGRSGQQLNDELASLSINRYQKQIEKYSLFPYGELGDLKDFLVGSQGYPAKMFSYKGQTHEMEGEVNFSEYFIQRDNYLLQIHLLKEKGLTESDFKTILASLKFFPSQMSQEQKNLNGAKRALLDYFTYLSWSKYSEASEYHGSGYDYLIEWNPSVDPNNRVSLLFNGCNKNGLNCLRMKQILGEKMISPTDFIFTVQFENPDGSFFKRGPCCGASEQEMPTKTDFEYEVKKEGDRFLVVTQPVYTP